MNTLIIVSNRLPFSVQADLSFVRSPGGLVSGLLTFIKKAEFLKEYRWIGWPGRYLDRKKFELVRKKARAKHSYPVYLSKELVEKFYNGFCNKIIWPLFHGFPSYVVYEEAYWETYIKVNEIFCEEVLKFVDKDSIIWIHDYHLMLLPMMIRERFPEAMIGFFLHIPFPPPEIFMQLPWKRELLEGLLGCDLIGFHTYEYTSNFLRTLMRTFGIDHKMGELYYQNRLVKVDTFPMGIDFDLYYNAANKRGVKRLVKILKDRFKGQRIIFSVDRLDYTKGIYNRLLAFEALLMKRPDLHGRVVLMIVVVPSREGVEHYQRMKKQLEEKISEVNGRFGTIEWIPILYYYRSLNFDELVAHYLSADVILVTPLKDGMNLIAKEFVASRRDLKGVLILSEFAGSAKELGEAILVNPNSLNELVTALETALDMPEETQRERLLTMQERLKRYDIVKWGKDFINSLNKLRELKEKTETKALKYHLSEIKQYFQRAKRKILFLDYDGTLTPIVSMPHLAIPDQELKELLKRLTEDSATEVVIISGRRKEDLDRWFNDIKVNLISEHGLFIKKRGGEWMPLGNVSSDFKEAIRNIMEIYVDRLPRSFIEEKHCSVSFHYRNADPELARLRVTELIDELLILTGTMQVNIILGNKVIEVRPAGADKGSAASLFLREEPFDFILAAGDDITDEDLFKSLPKDAFTIKVGPGKSLAKYSASSYKEIRSLLKEFIKHD